LDRGEFDLHEVIDSCVDLVADRIQEKQTPIQRDYAPEEIRGNWDGEQLREVFVNLLANAIDASEPGSPVRIATELVDAPEPKLLGAATAGHRSLARIVVADEGSGMDAKIQSRLFEPFFTTKKRGTGLGLSTVRQIVELHGGSIEAESEQGKGTTFQIELPLHHAVVPAES
jgi:signal transduction histidine kinase